MSSFGSVFDGDLLQHSRGNGNSTVSLAFLGAQKGRAWKQAIDGSHLDLRGTLYVLMQEGYIVEVYIHKSVLEQPRAQDTSTWLHCCSGFYMSGDRAKWPIATTYWLIDECGEGTKFSVSMVMKESTIDRILQCADLYEIQKLNFIPKPNQELVFQATGDNRHCFIDPWKLCVFVLSMGAKLFNFEANIPPQYVNKAKFTEPFGDIVQAVGILGIWRKLCGMYTVHMLDQYTVADISNEGKQMLYGLMGLYYVQQPKLVPGPGLLNKLVTTTELWPGRQHEFLQRYRTMQREQKNLFQPATRCIAQASRTFVPARKMVAFVLSLSQSGLFVDQILSLLQMFAAFFPEFMQQLKKIVPSPLP